MQRCKFCFVRPCETHMSNFQPFIIAYILSPSAFQNVVHVQRRNCKNKILQTNFGIVFWSKHLRHTHHIIFALNCISNYFTFSTVKYDANAAFGRALFIFYNYLILINIITKTVKSLKKLYGKKNEISF